MQPIELKFVLGASRVNKHSRWYYANQHKYMYQAHVHIKWMIAFRSIARFHATRQIRLTSTRKMRHMHTHTHSQTQTHAHSYGPSLLHASIKLEDTLTLLYATVYILKCTTLNLSTVVVGDSSTVHVAHWVCSWQQVCVGAQSSEYKGGVPISLVWRYFLRLRSHTQSLSHRKHSWKKALSTRIAKL